MLNSTDLLFLSFFVAGFNSPPLLRLPLSPTMWAPVVGTSPSKSRWATVWALIPAADVRLIDDGSCALRCRRAYGSDTRRLLSP